MSFKSKSTNLSGTPLSALPVVVLDTETTGLDTAKARVIEIGAVRLGEEDVDPTEADQFSQLVRPDIDIPAGSTEIHGLKDADVAEAPEFAEAFARFVDWAGDAVILGYSIGFDLAILKAEHERHGLRWRAPRSLDVRHLVQRIAPNLPDPSLETAAAWLQISVEERHRALSDAVLTAKVFRAIIPKLRERDIATLAQAERAARALTARQDMETEAGWAETGRSGETAGVREFARVDSYPYRHRVRDLMNTPPLIVDNDLPLKKALSRMTEKQVSSLYLEPKGEEGHGIITERDVLRAVDAEGGSALEKPTAAFAKRPLVTIGEDEFVYKAIARMTTQGFRHLAVVDREGALIGALSARDLLRQRADDAVALGDAIEAAENPAALGRVWSALTTVARSLDYEEVDARDIAAIISRELRALTKRAAELAEAEFAEAGKGEPPCSYALMVLGSGGRGESLLAMDQDNAIIYEKGEPGGEVDQWFEALAERFTEILDDAGVAYCPGDIMASNSAWRADLEGWRKTVGRWISRSRQEDLLNCDIFFDALAVHGERHLAETLRAETMEAAADSRTLLTFLSLRARDFDSPLGWFGRFRTDQGRIDLKKDGIMPIFSAARVAALEHGIEARATPERLQAAREREVASAKAINNLIEAHRILLTLILQQQLRDIEEGEALSNRVAPAQLSGFEREELKWALEQVPYVRDLLGAPVVG